MSMQQFMAGAELQDSFSHDQRSDAPITRRFPPNVLQSDASAREWHEYRRAHLAALARRLTDASAE